MTKVLDLDALIYYCHKLKKYIDEKIELGELNSPAKIGEKLNEIIYMIENNKELASEHFLYVESLINELDNKIKIVASNQNGIEDINKKTSLPSFSIYSTIETV